MGEMSEYVDGGVLELVVLFNEMGVRTVGSCGGHVDHGRLGPWIMFEDERVDDVIQRRRARGGLPEYEEGVKVDPFWEKIFKINGDLVKPVADLLRAYYKSGLSASDGTRLVLGVGKVAILCSKILNGEHRGNYVTQGLPLKIRERQLRVRQAEMEKFYRYVRERVILIDR